MKKSNFFSKYLNNINKSINILLEKNLNKLNFNNLRNLAKNNKIILTFVAVFVLFLSYLLLPTFYNQADITKEIKQELSKKLNLNFNFTKKLNYNFFPRPHFVTNQASIFDEKGEISSIKKIKIFVSLENLFSLKSIQVKDVILKNANFNFDNSNYNFFIKLLDKSFFDGNLKIKDSNIFFRNTDEEVLFINKIIEMKFYYDGNELINIVSAKNKIFNIPYKIEMYKDKSKTKLFTKLNFNSQKLQIENELSLNNETLLGKAVFLLNKSKSNVIYETNKNFFKYDYFDDLNNPAFIYKGNFNLKPFYSNIEGKTEELNLSYIFGSNPFILDLLKTELFNNNNLDLRINIEAKKVLNNSIFNNIYIKSNIHEGLIDLDNTNFRWKDFTKFKLSNTLIYVKNGELVLDGKLDIEINDYNEIYKFFLTPKNYRNKIEKINLNFMYNFDQKTAELKDIKIDNKFNQNINEILGNLILKKDNLQNKIYFKNLLNQAIKSYAG